MVRREGAGSAQNTHGAVRQSIDDKKAVARLDRHLKTQLKKLRHTYRRSIETRDPEAINDLRVATRRLNTILQVPVMSSPEKSVRKARKQLKQLRHALSAPRDLDVLLVGMRRWASATASRRRRQLWNLTIRHVREERSAVGKQAKRWLKRFDIEQLAAVVRKAARRTVPDRFSPATIAKVTREAERNWRAAIRSAQRDSDPARLHQVRIKTKTLRYLLELLPRVFANHEGEELIERLRNLQDELGAWRDQAELYRRLTVILADDPALEADQVATAIIDRARAMARLNDEHAHRTVDALRHMDHGKSLIDYSASNLANVNSALHLRVSGRNSAAPSAE